MELGKIELLGEMGFFFKILCILQNNWLENFLPISLPSSILQDNLSHSVFYLFSSE